MPLTTMERSQRANAEKTRRARTRRFDRFADEIRDHPEALDQTAQNALAEALADRGWTVHVPA